MGKVQVQVQVQSRLYSLQIVSLTMFFASACGIEKTLPILFWKSKDAAWPIDNDFEDEDSSEKLN